MRWGEATLTRGRVHGGHTRFFFPRVLLCTCRFSPRDIFSRDTQHSSDASGYTAVRVGLGHADGPSIHRIGVIDSPSINVSAPGYLGQPI
jgi:hypothetical protein